MTFGVKSREGADEGQQQINMIYQICTFRHDDGNMYRVIYTYIFRVYVLSEAYSLL